MLNGEAKIVLLIVGLIIIQMRKYFSKPKSSGGKVTVELDLSNYTTNQI